ncbi:MAG: PhoH family protein [Candidatus Moraniibacteriota bacterium]
MANPVKSKMFVLDTNVLMHDPTCIFRFAEHDVYIPMVVLEELDNHKKGTSEIARNVRQASRLLNEVIMSSPEGIKDGIVLAGPSKGLATGKLFLQTEHADVIIVPKVLLANKVDNQIIGIAKYLVKRYPAREVVLVSNDIFMRTKATAFGLVAQEYANDQVIEDTDLLSTGMLALPDDFWEMHGAGMVCHKIEGRSEYRIRGPIVAKLSLNQFVFLEGAQPFQAMVKETDGRTAVLRTLRDYGNTTHDVYGINARNFEQNFALNLLMDPEIDFITLLGQAGTGKTLLTLAAGIEQTIEPRHANRYNEIIFTRVTVPVGEDIGFLPGTEEEKMNPWMGALEDNLDVLNGGKSHSGRGDDDDTRSRGLMRATARDLIRSRIKVKSLNFMRGRTFLYKYLIIDEAQNLTQKQMKTLITRAGPGTKVVCLGNLAQIDTPYLTETNSGLTYVVKQMENWKHGGHIVLRKGERSRLADYAAEVL